MSTRKTVSILTLALSVCCGLGTIAQGEIVQRGSLRVTFDGTISPKTLPRSGSAPVRVSVGAKIAGTDVRNPPRLRTMTISINRVGQFSPGLFPTCTVPDIQPSTTENALDACGDALIGEGQFSAKVLLPRQAAFPSSGKLYAFNGRWHGRPAILAHVYGTSPVPTSFTLPFEVTSSKGTFGTVLRAALPTVIGKSGYITGISLNLGRTTGSGKNRRSYLSAGCPAPQGFPGAVFPFARADFGFGKTDITSTLTRNCKVRG
jgi:hypothetical protein